MSYSYFDVPKGTPKADIEAMLKTACPVAYDTFMRRVGFGTLRTAPFFDGARYKRNGRDGRSLKKDFSACLSRSQFQGRACYLVRYGGKNYVFLAEPEPDPKPDRCALASTADTPGAPAFTVRIENPRGPKCFGFLARLAQPKPIPGRVRVNEIHCAPVRLFLKLWRAFIAPYWSWHRHFSLIAIAMEPVNGPRVWKSEQTQHPYGRDF